MNTGSEQLKRKRVKDTSEVLNLGYSVSGQEYHVEVIYFYRMVSSRNPLSIRQADILIVLHMNLFALLEKPPNNKTKTN